LPSWDWRCSSAVRAPDGAEVRLRGGSYRANGEAARSDGRVVVRGLGTRGWRFRSVLGDAAWAGVGPGLMISGALQRPEDLR